MDATVLFLTCSRNQSFSSLSGFRQTNNKTYLLTYLLIVYERVVSSVAAGKTHATNHQQDLVFIARSFDRVTRAGAESVQVYSAGLLKFTAYLLGQLLCVCVCVCWILSIFDVSTSSASRIFYRQS